MSEQVREWFGESFSQVKIAARYNLITNTAIMVKHQVGVALCYDLGTTYYNSLRLVPLSPSMENGAVLAWKKEQARSRAVEQFITHIRESTRV